MRSILLIVSILALNACSIHDQRGRDSMSQWLYNGSTSASIGDVNRVNDWGSRLPNMPGDYERFCRERAWICRQQYCCKIATPVAHLQHHFGTRCSRELFVRSQDVVAEQGCMLCLIRRGVLYIVARNFGQSSAHPLSIEVSLSPSPFVFSGLYYYNMIKPVFCQPVFFI